MNLIKGRVRLFCVSNIIASFACTGLLGPQYLSDLQGLGQKNSNDVIVYYPVILFNKQILWTSRLAYNDTADN